MPQQPKAHAFAGWPCSQPPAHPMRPTASVRGAVAVAGGSTCGGGFRSEATSSTAVTAEARCCIICEAAPREVRFACGHAVVCGACLPSVVQQHGKCPTCGAAFGAQPVLEQGQQVAAGPTFVLPK